MNLKTLSFFIAGVLGGILILGSVRFVLAVEDPDNVHYHANWALVVDGERVDFTADRYMEDVAACVADAHHLDARARVHLHDNDMDVVHVHHRGVTWGHFLANLGWGLGPDWLMTDEGELYQAGDGGNFVFVVDGWVVGRLDDRVIDPGARVLIYWGREDPDRVAEEYFPQVAANAVEYDLLDDPGGCGAAQEPGLGDRLRRALLY